MKRNIGRYGHGAQETQSGMRAKKSLGQNFLTSTRVVGAIVSAGTITTGETVLEIGPGKGVLTRALLEAGAKVVAVEKDDRLIPILAQDFRKEIANGNLKLTHGDIMEMKSDEISKITGIDYKVIANIPYYITGAVIRNFLSTASKPSLMILMVQKEVANRIIARDGKESILSIAVKIFAKPALVMNVSRGNFFPVPNVDSAVLKLSDIRNPFKDRESGERFFSFVKAGFAQKRKKLVSNLGSVMDKEALKNRFSELGIDPNTRAEDIALATWLALSKGY